MARLTKRYPNDNVTLDPSGFTQNQETIDREIRNFTPALAAVERLAEFEDAEEKGLLAHLPCKVGDILYEIDKEEIYTTKVVEIHILSNNQLEVASQAYDEQIDELYDDEYNYYLCDFGKTVFLTPEAAKQALKERDTK